MGTIVVKNIDEDVYRRLKSVAALKGYTIGRALTEAMRLWLAFNEATSRSYLDYIVSREKSEKKLREIQGKYGRQRQGEYAVICDGELVGIHRDEDEARRAAAKSGARQCIIARLGRPPREEKVELGMGILR